QTWSLPIYVRLLAPPSRPLASAAALERRNVAPFLQQPLRRDRSIALRDPRLDPSLRHRLARIEPAGRPARFSADVIGLDVRQRARRVERARELAADRGVRAVDSHRHERLAVDLHD